MAHTPTEATAPTCSPRGFRLRHRSRTPLPDLGARPDPIAVIPAPGGRDAQIATVTIADTATGLHFHAEAPMAEERLVPRY